MHAAIRRAACLTVGLVLACAGTAAAAPPENDDPFDPPNQAFHLNAGAGTFDSATTGEATTYAGEPLSATDANEGRCTANGTQSQHTGVGRRVTNTVWWSFTGTGGPLTVSSYFSGFDTLVSVWTLESDDLLHFVKCNDDISDDDFTSELELGATTQNKTYYVQAGGCENCGTPDSGSLGLYVYPPPSNDRRAGARAIALNTNIPQETLGAREDPTSDGPRTCGGKPYGKTVWYRFTVPSTGTVTIDASGFDSAAALLQGGSAVPLACGTSPVNGATSFSRKLGAGTYLLQVGGQAAGIGAARGDLITKVTFVADTTPPPPPPPPVDSDGDGLVDSLDCAPNDRLRRQGFDEVRGNSRDEDCDGTAQDFFEVSARRGAADYIAGGRTSFKTLFVNRIAAGDTVTIICKGKGCNRKRYVKKFKTKRAKVNFAKAMRKNRPGKGAVLEIRVTHAKRIGHVWRYKFRFFKAPTLQEDLCLRPGAKKPKRCT